MSILPTAATASNARVVTLLALVAAGTVVERLTPVTAQRIPVAGISTEGATTTGMRSTATSSRAIAILIPAAAL